MLTRNDKKNGKKHKPNLIYLNKLKIDNQPKREKNEIAAWNKFDGLKIENKDKKKIKTNKQRFPQNKKALKEKPSQKLPVKIDHKFNQKKKLKETKPT